MQSSPPDQGRGRWLLALVVALAPGALPELTAQLPLPPLYASSGGSGLSVLDPVSFREAPLGVFGKGVVFTPDDRLLTTRGYYTDNLVELDPDTRQVIRDVPIVSRYGFRYTVDWLTYRASTGRIYAKGRIFSYLFPIVVLLRIDRQTGTAQEIRRDSAAGYQSGGISFSPDGTLFQLDNGSLLTLNPTTGATISSLPLSEPDYMALTVRPNDGALIGVSTSGSYGRIDPITGAVTALGAGWAYDLGYRTAVRGRGCPGSAPVLGPRGVSSPSSPRWEVPFYAPSVSAGACVLLLWAPERAALPLPVPPGCNGPAGTPCQLASPAPPLAVVPMLPGGWTPGIPAGLPRGPLLMLQGACIDTTAPTQPCAWLSADITVAIE
ncbi:MAG: hypothetical protein AAF628_13715 [Planctomycetota bacterium]